MNTKNLAVLALAAIALAAVALYCAANKPQAENKPQIIEVHFFDHTAIPNFPLPGTIEGFAA